MSAWGRMLIGLLTISVIASTAVAEEPSVEGVVAKYVAARGGAERWAAVSRLELRGSYATFSQKAPFVLLRQRPDRYRLDLEMLGEDVTVAHGADGPWWRFPLLQITEPSPVEIDAYRPQLAREAMFAPPLIGWPGNGVTVELLGPGDVDGQETVDLRLAFPGDGESGGGGDQPAVEVWHLDPATGLEVMVESTVVDYTQALEPMARRTYFSDFRPVGGGLVLPHRLEIEFGARLEIVEIEQAIVDPPFDQTRFALPAPTPAPAPR